MFFLGTAYSALSQNLTLEGTITIPKQDSSFTATITKNTIFSFFWRSTYDIKITNNGTADINSWFAVISVSNLTSESEVSAQTFISNGLNSYSVNLEQKNIVITKLINNCYLFYYYIGYIFIIDNILININNDLFK